MEQHVFSVTEVNNLVKSLLDEVPLLRDVYVRGELSNYKIYPSGHHYFTLKDPEGALRCVMFRGQASHLRFRPENGMQVIARGRISVFPRDGAYQLYCNTLTPEGAGDLAVAFEQLKARLYAEGLFDPNHKKPLPPYPEKIAIVTSSAGAAVHDMIRILRRRYPIAKVILLPVRVQGAEAPPEIAGAIRYADKWKIGDVIITGRGGGSMEDLWAFNEEVVARAIARSAIPVIAAVGHEPDVTIADFAADLRASTPSNGAERAVPDQGELRDVLAHWEARLQRAMDRTLQKGRDRLERAKASPFLQSPLRTIQEKRMLLDYQQQRLVHGMERNLQTGREQTARLAASLEALSPFRVLSRGYSIAQKEDGTVLSSIQQVSVGEALSLRLADGQVTCTATGKEKHRWQKRN
ncbi:exodeoxyribonuclease VII large subunit [Dysosmobacter sp.]|uniref:exodeoxyribonuclease VII large subunit n=1 Tax=Dysosmobacter sp. TaxID=2591382 RepID=UPI003A8DB060